MNTKRTTKDFIVRSAMTLILAVLATATVWGQNPASIGSISYNNSISAYEINSVANLNDLAVYVNGTGSYNTGATESEHHDCQGMTFIMTKDITYTYTNAWNVTSTENNYTPIGRYVSTDNDYLFNGHFNGDGHTIKGIRIYKSTGDSGIFGRLGEDAEVKNITLDDARITDMGKTGGIAGYNKGTIRNCHVTGNVAIHALPNDQGLIQYHGGIVGYNNGGRVEYCTSAVTLSKGDGKNSKHFGAIAGYVSGGTLSYNLAVGASIPQTTDNNTDNHYYGAITGQNNSGSLDHNYYSKCTVAGIDNATNVGCGGCDNNGTKIVKDITDNDGAVRVNNAVIISETPKDSWPDFAQNDVLFFYREFSGGTASTICLPFAYTPNSSDGTFYSFEGITTETSGDKTVYVATMLEANKKTSLNPLIPYIFMPAGKDTKLMMFHGPAAQSKNNSVAGLAAINNWTFKGTYTGEQWTNAPTGIYGFSAQAVKAQDIYQGQFVKVGEYVKIRSLRAYLQYSGSNFPNTRGTLSEEELPDRILVRLVDSNGDITGIGELDMKTGEVSFDGNWYTLEGFRLSGKPTKRGIYVNNGKKYIIK